MPGAARKASRPPKRSRLASVVRMMSGADLDDALRGHGDVRAEAGIDVLAAGQADHGAGRRVATGHQRGRLRRLQDEEHTRPARRARDQLLGCRDVGIQGGDQLRRRHLPTEDRAQRGDEVARGLDIVVVRQQQDGHARVAQLGDHLRRACLLVADDEAGRLGQDRLRGEEAVVAEVGLLLQRLRRVEAGGVHSGHLVLCAERIGRLREDATQRGHARGVRDGDDVAVDVGDVDGVLGRDRGRASQQEQARESKPGQEPCSGSDGRSHGPIVRSGSDGRSASPGGRRWPSVPGPIRRAPRRRSPPTGCVATTSTTVKTVFCVLWRKT